ncbi:hypothetical protein E6O75_ATG04128 [Venturia nashicola]|uniref:Uncharacterized protein n=1 Tax=Venturia nashicola TaxID=86259 RepID=A0A4Z1P6Y1_9PEZI|nr:hypothetical protein E6O75_ATG04128 [Venturia nashicola]
MQNGRQLQGTDYVRQLMGTDYFCAPPFDSPIVSVVTCLCRDTEMRGCKLQEQRNQTQANTGLTVYTVERSEPSEERRRGGEAERRRGGEAEQAEAWVEAWGKRGGSPQTASDTNATVGQSSHLIGLVNNRPCRTILDKSPLSDQSSTSKLNNPSTAC